MEKVSKEQCLKCKYADRTISYSDWWYCTNPKDFRDFTVLRDNCYQSPEWCPKKLLERVKNSIKVCEGYKRRLPDYYNACWKMHHELLLEIKEELENGSDHDR